MRTYISSKSLKRAAATLVLAVSVVSAGFGLTGCGSHGGGGMTVAVAIPGSQAQIAHRSKLVNG